MNTTSILTAAELAVLRTELALATYAGLSDAERFAIFHAPSILPNPIASAPLVPRPFNAIDLLQAIKLANRPALKPLLGDMRSDLDNQNRTAIGGWAYTLALLGDIDSDDVAAVLAILGRTMPDPAWTATVPGPSRKVALFGAASWTTPQGGAVDYVPLSEFAIARQ